MSTAGLAVPVVLSVIAGCGVTSAGSAGPSTSSTSSTSPSPAASTGSGTSSGSGSPSATGSASPATPPPSAPPSAAPSSESGDALEVTIRLVGGLPVDGVASIRVKRGQTVNLVGVSDTEDSLHVHGYDKTLEVHPGQRTTLSFVADVPGAFEVETHESEKLVAELAVR